MRGHLRAIASTIVFAAVFGAAPAVADVEWSGPGYYIADSVNDMLGGFIAGPFSSEADCKAALAALSQDEQKDSTCDYYAGNTDQS